MMGAILTITALNSACVAGPFQQTLPETQWTEDEHGNKVKVTLNANTEETTPTNILNTLDKYYNQTIAKTDDALVEVSFKDNYDNEEKLAEFLDIIKTKYPDIYDGIYYGNMSDKAKSQVIRNILHLGNQRTGVGDIEIPIQAVTVKGLKATIDSEELADEFKDSVGIVNENELPLRQIDGTWKIDGMVIAEHLGYYKEE